MVTSKELEHDLKGYKEYQENQNKREKEIKSSKRNLFLGITEPLKLDKMIGILNKLIERIFK